jgi:hypothetical protein
MSRVLLWSELNLRSQPPTGFNLSCVKKHIRLRECRRCSFKRLISVFPALFLAVQEVFHVLVIDLQIQPYNCLPPLSHSYSGIRARSKVAMKLLHWTLAFSSLLLSSQAAPLPTVCPMGIFRNNERFADRLISI